MNNIKSYYDVTEFKKIDKKETDSWLEWQEQKSINRDSYYAGELPDLWLQNVAYLAHEAEKKHRLEHYSKMAKQAEDEEAARAFLEMQRQGRYEYDATKNDYWWIAAAVAIGLAGYAARFFDVVSIFIGG